jgi:predicted hydrolase (HD superfamily)
MKVLEEWWNECDPEKSRTCTLQRFRVLLKSKRIIVRDSEIYRLLKKTIPRETVTEECLRESQFMKIFARPILRGAIVNIFVYTRD